MRKIKQKKIKQQPVTIDENYPAKNMFLIIIIILVLLVPLYFITKLVVNNDNKSETVKEITPVKIQTEKILVGQLLNRPKTSYYVIAYKQESKMVNLFNQYISDYKKNEDHLEFYKIDLDDGLNKGYISDTTNITDELKDLKISDTTLFKIVDGKIDSYYIGNTDVVNALKEIND